MRIYLLIIIFVIIASQCVAQNDSASMTADTTLAGQYFNKAKTFAREAQFDSSNYYYQKANVIYEKVTAHTSESGLWEKYVTSVTNIAVNLYRIGEYQNALEYLQQALALGVDKLDENSVALTNVYNELGVVHYFKGEYPTAFDFYNKALAKRLALFGADHPRVADSYNNLAMIFEAKGDFQKSLDYFQKAHAIFIQTYGDEHIQVACTYHNIGLMYRKIGDYDRALDYFQKSLAIDIKLSGEINPNVAITYHKIGTIYGINGDYDKALEYFHKSLAINKEVFGENDAQMTASYNDMGVVAQKQGDFERALDYFNKALAIDLQTKGEQHPDVAIGYGNIGVIYGEQGDYDQALEYHRKAITIHLQSMSENHPFAVETYRNIGQAYSYKSDDENAIAYYGKALAIQKNISGEKNPQLADLYQTYSEFYLKRQQFKHALTMSQKAIIALTPAFSDTNIDSNPLLSDLRWDEQTITTLTLKADALRQCYLQESSRRSDLEISHATYQLITDLIDNVRSSYQAEGSKLFLEEKTATIYAKAIQVALNLYDITKNNQYREAAFFSAEKAKAGILLASVQDLKAKQFTGIPDSLLERERQLKLDLALFDTQLQKELQKKENQDSLMINELRAKLFLRHGQYQDLIQQFEKTYPHYYDLKYQTQRASIAQLQQTFAPNTAMVEYLDGDDTIFIFTITKDAFDVVPVRKDTSFYDTVESLARALRKAELSNFVKAGSMVYNQLIKPIENRLTAKKRLIIIPDGVMFRIPFETLLANESEGSVDLTKLDYLINRFEISYHYSGTLYGNTFTNKAVDGDKFVNESFIGFAPVFSEQKQNSYILASNFPALAVAPQEESDARAINVDGKRIQELIYSEKEVSAIIDQFNRNGKTAIGYFHSTASEDNFKQQCGKYRLVHVSTHGIINEERPQLSGIIFSQPHDSLYTEDGILYAGETYHLDLQADLLVLSSCESGIGKLIKGEGMMALTRGFFYAGASNILVSLWKISDKQTSRLMVDFYKNILAGKSNSHALRNAKLKMIKNEATAFPKSWAGFVLLGR